LFKEIVDHRKDSKEKPSKKLINFTIVMERALRKG
jgi:hypothetical protein